MPDADARLRRRPTRTGRDDPSLSPPAAPFGAAGIGPELFAFLRELGAHNDRAWFAANRARYDDHVRDPLLCFIADFGPRLAEISPQFVADPRPAGGSLFRIHRDTRFSRDKAPYKTNAGVQFRHAAGRDAHAPGFYLHLEAGEVFAAAGLWHPGPTELGKVRDAIVERSEEWGRLVAAPAVGPGSARPLPWRASGRCGPPRATTPTTRSWTT